MRVEKNSLRVISKKALRIFWQRYPEAEHPLKSWYKIARKSNWDNLVDVRKDFSHADPVGRFVAFNVGGNKYRLITKINFRRQIVYIRFILTHKEYSKEGWKDDCGR
jgi:mRNA interferase HigB